MVENYQQEQTLKEPETPNYTFATIGQIYDDGMSLIFPGLLLSTKTLSAILIASDMSCVTINAVIPSFLNMWYISFVTIILVW